MTDISSLLSNPDAERDGIWFPVEGSFRMRIASTLTKEYERAKDAAYAPYREAIRKNVFPDDLRDKVECELAARHLIKDWAGLTRNGEPWVYSPDAAVELLSMPGSRWLKLLVSAVAESVNQFKAENVDAALKN